MGSVAHFPMICNTEDENFSNNHLSTSVYTRQRRKVNPYCVQGTSHITHSIPCSEKDVHNKNSESKARAVMDGPWPNPKLCRSRGRVSMVIFSFSHKHSCGKE